MMSEQVSVGSSISLVRVTLLCAAAFPETVLSYFIGPGYTQNSGSDWLGYVYPNANGNVPVIQ